MAGNPDFDCPSSRLISSGEARYDAETGVVEMDFAAPTEFTSPRGLVQGGLVAAFLDEVMGAAVLHASRHTLLPLNLDLTMSFLRPVPIGPLLGKARVVRMGRKVAFIEGELFDPQGTLLARATSTAIPTPLPGAE